jgi:hypothetical protein
MFSTRWALETFIRRLGNLSPLSRDDMAFLRSRFGSAAMWTS